MEINIGLSENAREEVAKGLCALLADSYTLYLKTQNFHWNVTGPHFQALHALFETQYTDLATAIDEIAERIRALGFPAPGSYAEFAKLTNLEEASGAMNAEAMVRSLVLGQEKIIARVRDILPIAEKDNDAATVDLLTRRTETHEKNAWMLRSSL